MAHTISVKKRVRSSAKRGQRNKSLRSRYKTYITKAEKAILSGDHVQAEEAVKQAVSILDKTSGQGIIPQNNAARHKSQLVKHLAASRDASRANAE